MGDDAMPQATRPPKQRLGQFDPRASFSTTEGRHQHQSGAGATVYHSAFAPGGNGRVSNAALMARMARLEAKLDALLSWSGADVDGVGASE